MTKIFLQTRIEIPERVLPLVFLAFAVWLLSVDVFANIPAYAAAAILPEAVWAMVFGSAGIYQIYATFTRRRKLRRSALLISSIVWIVWALLIISSLSKGFGAIVYTSIAVISVWTYVRARH